MAPSDGAMDSAAKRIGAAMGWLIERARERQRHLTTPGTIASLAWTEALKEGVLKGKEQLATRLRRLDKSAGLEWWSSEAGRPYTVAVAGVLKVEPAEFLTWFKHARAASDDDARWFHFEVFPGLRPLDLDAEDPFPGIPGELFAGDGPTQLTWWHAPQGAGKTLVARWLVRRHRWTIGTPASVTELSFIEQDSVRLPDVGRARRVIVASPHPMPAVGQGKRWTQAVTPTGWELPLVNWVTERLPDSGHYDHPSVEALVEKGLVAASTPGQLLEILADVHTLGVGALEDTIAPHLRLEAWVRAHPRRADRTARPASRAYLGERGADLLREIELHRLHRGLPVSSDAVIACFPELPHASPDAIQSARDAGDVDRALQLLCPDPKDLVATMVDLRWIIEEGWGFPTRVAGWLRASVIQALVQGCDMATLGAVSDAPEMAFPVVRALAAPTHLAAWASRIEAVRELDPETALGLDAIVLAMTLSAALGHAVPEDVRTRLQGAVVRLASEVGVGVRVRVDPRWWALAWLSLFPPAKPPTSLQRERVMMACELLYDQEDESALLRPLRLLAADRLGDLAATDRASFRTDLPSAAVADLAAGAAPDPQALERLQSIRRLDVVERLCRRWASTPEALASLLWPTWEHTGVPEDADPARLGRVWASCPPERLPHVQCKQLRDHIRRGVPLPENLWLAAIELYDARADVAERAPVSVLLASADKFAHVIPAVVWRRAPEAALEQLAALLKAGTDTERWLRVAPVETTGAALALLAAVETASPGSLAWSDRMIAARAPGWQQVWQWRMASWRTP